MEEKILLILKDTINNQFFYYVLLFSIVIVILNGMWNYKGYLKDCQIFKQKPKPIGYVKNILDNIILISILSTLTFMGYVSLDYAENEPEPTTEIRYIKDLPTDQTAKKEIIITKEIRKHKPIKMTIMETSYQQKEITRLRKQLTESQKRENHYKKQMNLYIKKFKDAKKQQAVSIKSNQPCKGKEILHMRNGKVFKKEIIYN